MRNKRKNKLVDEQIIDAEQTLKDLQKRVDIYNGMVKQHIIKQADIDKLDEKLEEREDIIKILELKYKDDIKKYEKEIKGLIIILNKATTDKEKFIGEIHLALIELKELKESNKKEFKKSEVYACIIDKSNSIAEKLEVQIKDLKLLRKDLGDDIDNLKKEKKEYEELLILIKSNVSSSKKELDEITESLDKIKKEHGDADKEKVKLYAEIWALSEKRVKLNLKIEEDRKDFEIECEKKIDILKEEKEDLRIFKESLAYKEEKLKGIKKNLERNIGKRLNNIDFGDDTKKDVKPETSE